MKRPSSDSRRLEQVLQDLEDGTLGEDDHGWLMSQLRQRPEVREAYRQHLAFAAALHDTAAAWIPEYEERQPSMISPSRRRWMSRNPWLAVAAVVTLLAAAASWTIHRRMPVPASSITASSDATWEFAAGGLAPGGDFQSGTALRVDGGSVEVVTRQRTRVIVEGPARLSMESPGHMSLSSGSGWFETLANDTITVTTGRMQMVSTGSHFGVAVAATGHRIQVKSGNLRVIPVSAGATPIILGPGQAGTLDGSGKWVADPVDPGLFLHQLAQDFSFIHWSFDEESSGTFPATSRGIDAAAIKLAGVRRQAVVPRLTAGAFGAGLDLTSGDAFGESDFAGISGSGPRSVAVWVKGAPILRRKTPDRVEYTPSVVQWGDESIDGGSWTFRAHCVGGIIGTQWGGNGLLTAGVNGSMSVLDGRWHHIASVFTGEVHADGTAEVRHYIDGQRVPTTTSLMDTPIDTRVGFTPATRLRVACDPRMPGANVPVMIDELFIVRGALTDGQIKRLKEENRLLRDK